MLNSSNLTQALEQLKREIQKETQDLSQKESALKALVTEKQVTEDAVRKSDMDIKQKEIEVNKLKMEVPRLKTKLVEIERNSRKLSDEINVLKREQNTKNMELTKVQHDYQDAVKKANNAGQAKYGRSVL